MRERNEREEKEARENGDIGEMIQQLKAKTPATLIQSAEDDGEHADDTVSLGLESQIVISNKKANHALSHESSERFALAEEIQKDFAKNHVLLQTAGTINIDEESEALLVQGKGEVRGQPKSVEFELTNDDNVDDEEEETHDAKRQDGFYEPEKQSAQNIAQRLQQN